MLYKTTKYLRVGYYPEQCLVAVSRYTSLAYILEPQEMKVVIQVHLMPLARRKSVFNKCFHLSCNILKDVISRSTDTECCYQAQHELKADIFQPVCRNKTW
jgi:hypothetical protein